MVLSIVLVLGMIIGPADALPTRRVVGAAAAGAYVLIVLANFYYLYPVLVGDIIPYELVACPDVVRLVDLTAHTRVWRRGRLEAENFPAEQISDYLAEPDTTVWLDLCSPDAEGLKVISEEFGLDPMAVEDALSHHERPKLDRYEGHLFLNAYAVRLEGESGDLRTR